MNPSKIKSLVTRWQDARLSWAPKRVARLGEEIMERVNEELEEIKQTPRNPKFEWSESCMNIEAHSHYWLRLDCWRRQGYVPRDQWSVSHTVTHVTDSSEERGEVRWIIL
jgi:hypothetical protein